MKRAKPFCPSLVSLKASPRYPDKRWVDGLKSLGLPTSVLAAKTVRKLDR